MKASHSVLILCAASLLLLVSGVYTVDYGVHWDEPMTINLVADSIQKGGRLLPGRYTYPSNLYALGMITAVPKWAMSGFDSVVTSEWVRSTPAYKNSFRFAAYVLTNIACIWVGLLVITILGRRWAAGLVGFLLLASSFEFHYHSRWIASDDLMAQFGVLSLLLSVLVVQHPEKKKWMWLAVVAAGLAASTKYPGGLLVIPLCTAIGIRARKLRESWLSVARGVVLAGLGAFAVYLIATPGTVLDAPKFVEDVKYEMHHYRTAGHFGYTTTPGIRHAEHIVRYLAWAGLSYFEPISVTLFAASFLGAIWLYRNQKAVFWVLVPFPPLYALYFAQQRAVIVRNYLVLLPCFAVLATLGLFAVYDRMKTRRAIQLGLAGALVALIGVNVVWLAYADLSIVRRRSRDFKTEVLAYLEHPPEPVALSPRVATLVGKETSGHGLLKTLVFMSEFKDPFKVPANVRGKYKVLPGGPFEINFDYYPTWAGDDRLVVMPTEDLLKINAP